ncbi:hypothetical protein M885DRAFT_550408 [Pelagophyceae sp. CCMP2097]|nr:hypothetical protein M885DRAFT_550408 [Pelagophyceae sp. CCMP2097]
MFGLWGRKALPDPGAPLGLSFGEMAALPQLQYQLFAIVAAHAALHLLLTSVPSPFAARAGYAAHYLPFVVCFAAMAAVGCHTWLCDAELAELGATQAGRMWGSHAGAARLVASMLAVQLYDVPTSCVIPELQSPTFIAHHLVVLFLACAALRYNAFMYYGVYFFGVIETSTPLLALVDGFRDFPKLAEKLPATNEACRVGFAVAFFAVRIVGWVPVSVAFWRDALTLFEPGAARHGIPLVVVAFWLATHLGLTVLQWHWGLKIARAAYAMASGDESQRENEAKGA